MKKVWNKKSRSGDDSVPSMRFVEPNIYKGRGFCVDNVDDYKVKMYTDPVKITIVVQDLFTRFIEEDVTSEMLQSGAIESVAEIHGRLVGESKSHIYISQHMYYDGQMFVFGVPKGCIIDRKIHGSKKKKK